MEDPVPGRGLTLSDCPVSALAMLDLKYPSLRRFWWVTDMGIDESNAFAPVRAGRARWRIENETFNTPENQGYGFEYNHGHGRRHLAMVFAMLTMPAMLAFLIDQARQRCCALFRAARKKEGRARYFWERLRSQFLEFIVPDWEALYRAIAFGRSKGVLEPPDSY